MRRIKDDTEISQEDLNFMKNIKQNIENQFKLNFKKSEEQINKYLLDFLKILSEYNKELKEITEVNKIIEETSCNILLAIRQNEYLQAYYPQNDKLNNLIVNDENI